MKTCMLRPSKKYPFRRHQIINGRWATRRTDGGDNAHQYWTLTHRPTGLDATALLPSLVAAVALARTLDRTYGAKAWRFTNPINVPAGARETVQSVLRKAGRF